MRLETSFDLPLVALNYLDSALTNADVQIFFPHQLVDGLSQNTLW
jgi:hypothetical protein